MTTAPHPAWHMPGGDISDAKGLRQAWLMIFHWGGEDGGEHVADGSVDSGSGLTGFI